MSTAAVFVTYECSRCARSMRCHNSHRTVARDVAQVTCHCGHQMQTTEPTLEGTQ